jgi:hypothetical protein
LFGTRFLKHQNLVGDGRNHIESHRKSLFNMENASDMEIYDKSDTEYDADLDGEDSSDEGEVESVYSWWTDEIEAPPLPGPPVTPLHQEQLQQEMQQAPTEVMGSSSDFIVIAETDLASSSLDTEPPSPRSGPSPDIFSSCSTRSYSSTEAYSDQDPVAVFALADIDAGKRTRVPTSSTDEDAPEIKKMRLDLQVDLPAEQSFIEVDSEDSSGTPLDEIYESDGEDSDTLGSEDTTEDEEESSTNKMFEITEVIHFNAEEKRENEKWIRQLQSTFPVTNRRSKYRVNFSRHIETYRNLFSFHSSLTSHLSLQTPSWFATTSCSWEPGAHPSLGPR